LAFSKRPLLLEEIAEAVILKPQRNFDFENDRLFDPHVVLIICSGLVSLSIQTREVQLAHYSVKKYLTSGRIQQASISIFNIQRISTHKKIAETCLTYLLWFDESKLPVNNRNGYPLLGYSSSHWFDHARDVPDDSTLVDMSARLLGSLGGNALSTWLDLFEPGAGPMTYVERQEAEKMKYFEPQRYTDLYLGTPLYYASYCGLAETAAALLHNGADVNAAGGRCGNALSAAAYQGHTDVVRILIQNGASPNSKGGFYGNALLTAVCEGHEAVVSFLLKNGA
jgi:ankyrin repeat domain-containing protein 50